MDRWLRFLLITLIGLMAYLNVAQANTANVKTPRHVILFIWDGLRPDSISPIDTPNLYRLKQEGAWFSDNHSSYPTITMINAATFATGDFAGKTGFYGNVLWDPRTKGVNAKGKTVNFNAPVFTEDYKILQQINCPKNHAPLFFVDTLFAKAQKANIKTASIGKSGAAFIQDYQQHGIVVDEKHIFPLEYAEKLEKDAYPLPKDIDFAFKQAHLTTPADTSNPTAFGKVATLKVISGGALGLDDDFMYPDNVTSDPTATHQSPYSQSNEYLMKTYLTKVLPDENPTLSVIWLRNPDTTEHNYGVGSPSDYTALQDQDRLLGKLLKKLKALNLLDKTDLIIASDHGHSNVSGPLSQFPLRLIHNGMVSVPDENGFSTSGDFRPADLIARAGFHAYDGHGCGYDPVLSGITETGNLVYPIKFDVSEKICTNATKINNRYGKPDQSIGHLYTTPSYKIPTHLPNDAIIVANNGGSTYLYIVNHDPNLVKKVIRFLQSREEFGAIFVDDEYPEMEGTLPLSLINIYNPKKRNPDIIVGSNFDETAIIRGKKGIEFNNAGIDRGMHGSFSPMDVHNTLLAVGPDFKSHFIDPLPSGNVDVAPTIAYLLHLNLPNTDGRPLLEALNDGLPLSRYTTIKMQIKPHQPASNILYQLATNPDGKIIDKTKTHYTMVLKTKLLLIDRKQYQYFDTAKASHY
jgi:arylsulfatase A-like enzyme